MNPYTNQGNNAYLPYGQQQSQYMASLPVDIQSVVNGFPSQKIDGNASNASGSPQQQPASFDPALMANLIAKRQMYGQSSQPQPQQQQQQQQQQTFSPTNSPMTGSPAISSMQQQQSPRQQQSPMMNNTVMAQIQQQQQQQGYRTPNMNNTSMNTPNTSNINTPSMSTPNMTTSNMSTSNMITPNNMGTPNMNPNQQLQWSKQQQQIAQMQRMDDPQRHQFILLQQQQHLRKQQMQQMQQMQAQQQAQQQQAQQQTQQAQQAQQQQAQQSQQQAQQQQAQQIQQTPVIHNNTTMSPMSEQQSSPMAGLDMLTEGKRLSPVNNVTPTTSTANGTDINTKRVEVVLALNIELIRLCIESQNTGVSLEPNLGIYQARLQSNLTYLATMADISMVKPGEEYKTPSPPDLKPLPPPKSEIGKKIHEILSTAQGLFNERKEESPRNSNSNNNLQQQMMRQQAAAMRQQQQQQFLKSSSPTSTPTTPRNMMTMDPQSLLRQQQQQQLRQQQQQMMMGLGNGYNSQLDNTSPTTQQFNPNDLLTANGMINPNNIMMNPSSIMNNMYNNQNDDPNNYNNVMMMMQRLQQQQQNQNQ